MLVPGYEVIEEVSRGDSYAVYRGVGSADKGRVLLKLPIRNPAGRGELEMLEREYELLGTLDVRGVPRIHDLVRHDASCCLVLEDRGGDPLGSTTLLHRGPGSSSARALLPRRRVNLDRCFKIAIQLATILTELHKRDIIHQNINPGSILVHPDTCEVSLGDFHLALHAANGSRTSVAPPVTWKTLLYLSPEQTGRMNREVDYRTDFYSLGVTLYEMLVGAPPFLSDDPLELIHWHAAKTPPAPSELNSEIPEPLSRLVMRLLSKTADERYNSASGLREDLEICEKQWAERRWIAPFQLGLHDVSDRFMISQKLYGREREVTELIAAFDRVCRGETMMTVVGGYSGIGKTSLIEAMYKPIARQRGFFISGKFDQVVRNVPFGALIQAFRALVRQLLAESEDRVAQWRGRLTQALGANGGVLAEVLPEIELITGPQPPAPVLDPTEALNRFQLVFQQFAGALAGPEHPLVIFLDDLQWADSATLSLLGPLLTSPDIGHLFLIGAYRDNEVGEGHPLVRTLERVESAGAQLRRIILGPLRLQEMTLLVGDTLHGGRTAAAPLARLALEKTDGNPFFVNQFLRTLKHEGFLAFDYERRRWTYSIDDIAGAGITENVVDLMTRKIQRLPSPVQEVLKLAACIGSRFDMSLVAMMGEQSTDATSSHLRVAVGEGLLIPSRGGYETSSEGTLGSALSPAVDSYGFLHDRIQQAAYALVPDDRKKRLHLTIGRLLRDQPSGAGGDDKLFDVVHHLNEGRELITEKAERVGVANLDLAAGRKAKNSTAYQSALEYLLAGVSLLDEVHHWETCYDLVFALHLEAAECQYLCGDFEAAGREFELLLARAANNLDRAKVHGLRAVQYENLSRYADALSSARAGLRLLGVSFPDSGEAKQAALEEEIESIRTRLGSRGIDSLIDLPPITDPEIRMVMSILTRIWAPAYISGDQVLTRLISAMLVRLSLVHGNAEESAYGYVTHAITVGPELGDFESAYEFGRLALRVNDRFKDSKLRAKVYQQFHAHANLWRRPLQTCVPLAREACRSGLESGDFLYAAYGAATESWAALPTTQDLAQFVRDYSTNLELVKKLRAENFADALNLMLSWARALQGRTEAPNSLSCDEFDEKAYIAAHDGNPFFTMFHAVARLQLGYVFEEYDSAKEYGRKAHAIAHHLSGTIWPVLLDFWCGLTLAAIYDQAGDDHKKSHLDEIRRAQARFEVLAENCPENFRCQWLMLSAEIERVSGRQFEALAFYERALEYAQETRMVQHQALANELCGRFWLGRDQKRVAGVYLSEARNCYARWGADAKVQQLSHKYGDLLGLEEASSSDPREHEPVSLDVATVTKAARALTAEIELDDLLKQLMQISLENAGAERGFFLRERGGQLVIEAEGALGKPPSVRQSIPAENYSDLSHAIVRYVRKTGESVVLGDAAADETFASDPYVKERRPKSILCVPIIHQGRSSGILYLENNLATDAFTSDRIEMMRILSATAAIAIQKASLYEEMKQEAASRQRAEETLRQIVDGTAAVTGSEFFRALVRHLARAIGVRCSFVTECLDRSKVRVKTLAFWNGDSFAENVEFDVELTPCKKVVEGEVCYYPTNLQQLFPGDTDLAGLNAESYIGLPMFDSTGDVIGHLVVIDDEPMSDPTTAMSILRIFAARAAAELQRYQAEEGLRRALEQVEELKNRLHAENLYLQEEIREQHNFEEIVGSSPALLDTLREAERVAPTDSTVLILGETGTGKELIARAIHNRGNREGRPLVKVNCGAISAGLVESELFGHVKGAFTGAFERRTGRFELANGGTLFLDEVGELPLETQVKLLRVLQEGEFEPVGSSRTVKVDVRIIAATNQDIEKAVKAGRFRSDLFYRLNVFPIRLPALRERKADIPQLVLFFLSRFSKKCGKRLEGVSQATMDRLVRYSWPGNVRELQNVIERGVVLSQGPVLTLAENILPVESSQETRTANTVADQTGPALGGAPQSLDEIERRHILSVLHQSGWVIEGQRGAARILNLHPNTLRSRMKKLGIRRPAS
jgi:predicted ATPase/transcriptional regulator with GAF, ATPase, and Fis domain